MLPSLSGGGLVSMGTSWFGVIVEPLLDERTFLHSVFEVKNLLAVGNGGGGGERKTVNAAAVNQTHDNTGCQVAIHYSLQLSETKCNSGEIRL